MGDVIWTLDFKREKSLANFFGAIGVPKTHPVIISPMQKNDHAAMVDIFCQCKNLVNCKKAIIQIIILNYFQFN